MNATLLASLIGVSGVVVTATVSAIVTAWSTRRSTQATLLSTEKTSQAGLESTRLTLAADRERRITELYNSAVEQLGNKQAPVRLGGLYALERLAQDNSEHRQTIVNVICAYLRMPYVPPDDYAPPASAPRSMHDESDVPLAATPSDAAQEKPKKPRLDGTAAWEELQVRLTAQSILARHLERQPARAALGDSVTPPGDLFWDNTHINLTGALLVDLDFRSCEISDAQFTRANFSGTTEFTNAKFHGPAQFTRATFLGPAEFGGASFNTHAWFNGAEFRDSSWFGGVYFGGKAAFAGVVFAGRTCFGGCDFGAAAPPTVDCQANFRGANFLGHTSFGMAAFEPGSDKHRSGCGAGGVDFGKSFTTVAKQQRFRQMRIREASRHGGSYSEGSGFRSLRGAHFFHGADFENAVFAKLAEFGEAIFDSVPINFTQTTFHADAGFRGAVFHDTADFGSGGFLGGSRPAIFEGRAEFAEARFDRVAAFGGVSFGRDADFADVFFGDTAAYGSLESVGARSATFAGGADFRGVTFGGKARFAGVTFAKSVTLEDARVAHVSDAKLSEWPAGWTVKEQP